MSTFSQRKAESTLAEALRPCQPPELVPVGTQRLELRAGRSSRLTDVVEVEVMADRRNPAKVRAYRFPDGSLQLVGSGPTSTTVTPLGVVRRRDRRRGDDTGRPNTTIIDRFEVPKSAYRDGGMRRPRGAQ